MGLGYKSLKKGEFWVYVATRARPRETLAPDLSNSHSVWLDERESRKCKQLFGTLPVYIQRSKHPYPATQRVLNHLPVRSIFQLDKLRSRKVKKLTLVPTAEWSECPALHPVLEETTGMGRAENWGPAFPSKRYLLGTVPGTVDLVSFVCHNIPGALTGTGLRRAHAFPECRESSFPEHVGPLHLETGPCSSGQLPMANPPASSSCQLVSFGQGAQMFPLQGPVLIVTILR